MRALARLLPMRHGSLSAQAQTLISVQKRTLFSSHVSLLSRRATLQVKRKSLGFARTICMSCSERGRVEMEVTRSNYEKVLPLVLEKLKTCSYVAIDGEFTGLHMQNERRDQFFDDPEERYSRVRESAQRFLIMQFGLSMVQWEEAKGAYVSSTFSFYTFPRSYENVDLRFVCQASSIDFLRKHNFDFNKFVYEGISYLPLDVYRKNASSMPRRRDPITLTRPDDIAFVGLQIDNVRQWVNSTHPPSSMPKESRPPTFDSAHQSGGESESGTTTDSSAKRKERDWSDELAEQEGWEEPRFTLDPANGFLRAALYEELEREFGTDKFYIERVNVGEFGDLALQLTRATAEGVARHEAEVAEARKRKLQEAAGFAFVVQALVDSGKPLVGHNMFYDLMYFYQQFVQPLPPTFEEFRKEIVQLFPGGIFDTKHLAKQFPRIYESSGSSLETVYSSVTAEPQVAKEVNRKEPHSDEGNEGPSGHNQVQGRDSHLEEKEKPLLLKYDLSLSLAKVGDLEASGDLTAVKVPPVLHAEGFDSYRDLGEGASMAHDAGYDAFMTGAAFAGLSHLLEARSSQETLNPKAGNFQQKDLYPPIEALSSLRNQIHVMKSDMMFFPLEGPIAVPDRSSVFLLSNFKPETKTSDLLILFESLKLGAINVIWIDQTSAYAVLLDKTKSALVVNAVKESEWVGHCLPFSNKEGQVVCS